MSYYLRSGTLTGALQQNKFVQNSDMTIITNDEMVILIHHTV